MEEKHNGLSHNSQCQSQDLNLGLPKYEAGVQTNMVNDSIIRVLIWDLLKPHFIAYMYNLFNKVHLYIKYTISLSNLHLFTYTWQWN